MLSGKLPTNEHRNYNMNREKPAATRSHTKIYPTPTTELNCHMIKYCQIFPGHCAIAPKDMFYNPTLDTTRCFQYKKYSN